MNIKEAKNQIKNTLRAYLERDEFGNYMIPVNRQRPMLLIGPPGIGKTQIMEQIAAETGTGLVAYTITHHTRQSAIGLPFIEKRQYGDDEFSVTEYTMSEILGSVYQLMEKTGIKEGILFLDEINCVSETLAPMMLQFLQCKTFGNQKLPEGWMIVAAGNPPEYNRSVRDFDVVTLDRVRLLNVEENYAVWKEYAVNNRLHSAVVSYLDIKKDFFYHIETTAEGLQFATARGWEDLSETLYANEKLGILTDRTVVEQFIRVPMIAKDFANYLSLFYKYRRTYKVNDILDGTVQPTTISEFVAAPFDERLSVMSLIYSGVAERARKALITDQLTESLHADLLDYKSMLADGFTPAADANDHSNAAGTASASSEGTHTDSAAVNLLESMIKGRRMAQKRAEEAGQKDKLKREMAAREIKALEDYLALILREEALESDAAFAVVKVEFSKLVAERKELIRAASTAFDNAFAFLENSIGASQEMVLFVTEITAGNDTSQFVEKFGCDAYFRNNSDLLVSETRRRILREIDPEL